MSPASLPSTPLHSVMKTRPVELAWPPLVVGVVGVSGASGLAVSVVGAGVAVVGPGSVGDGIVGEGCVGEALVGAGVPGDGGSGVGSWAGMVACGVSSPLEVRDPPLLSDGPGVVVVASAVRVVGGAPGRRTAWTAGGRVCDTAGVGSGAWHPPEPLPRSQVGQRTQRVSSVSDTSAR